MIQKIKETNIQLAAQLDEARIENETLRAALKDCIEALNLCMSRAGAPDAAQACRNVIDTAKWVITKHSELIKGLKK